MDCCEYCKHKVLYGKFPDYKIHSQNCGCKYCKSFSFTGIFVRIPGNGGDFKWHNEKCYCPLCLP
jgi:hypothetical protein